MKRVSFETSNFSSLSDTEISVSNLAAVAATPGLATGMRWAATRTDLVVIYSAKAFHCFDPVTITELDNTFKRT